jgi:hypothetical protein
MFYPVLANFMQKETPIFSLYPCEFLRKVAAVNILLALKGDALGRVEQSAFS